MESCCIEQVWGEIEGIGEDKIIQCIPTVGQAMVIVDRVAVQFSLKVRFCI